jgi:hypothetical protein
VRGNVFSYYKYLRWIFNVHTGRTMRSGQHLGQQSTAFVAGAYFEDKSANVADFALASPRCKACYAKPMTWARKLAKPIALKDGCKIETLGEAREMMLSLPPIHRRSPVWRFAAELLNYVAADRASVSDAEAQFTRALKAEGLI